MSKPSRRSVLGALGALCAGCGSSKPADAPTAPAARGPVLEYDFASLDERPVSRQGLQGRATIVAFLSSFGDASLLEARYVKKVFREHSPRINAAAVFLEPIDNRPLVRVFRDAADLPFPAAMGDQAAITGQSAFVGIDTVPSVVILDAAGREVWRKVGLTSPEELQKALREAQREVWGP